MQAIVFLYAPKMAIVSYERVECMLCSCYTRAEKQCELKVQIVIGDTTKTEYKKRIRNFGPLSGCSHTVSLSLMKQW